MTTAAVAGDNAIAHQSAETQALTNCLESVRPVDTPMDFPSDPEEHDGLAFGAALLALMHGLPPDESGLNYVTAIVSAVQVDPCSPEDPFFGLLVSQPDLGQDPVLITVKAPPGHPGAVVAQAMSATGVVVGHVSYDGGGAFRWTADDGIAIIAPGANASANAVTPDGQTVAGQLDFLTAFRWTAALGPVNLGAFVATGISDDGTVIAGTSTTLHQQAQRWGLTDPLTGTGTATGLGFLGAAPHVATFSEANAISGDGTVIVGDGQISDVGATLHAFKVLGAGPMQDLGTASGLVNSKALAVNRHGTVIVGTSWSDANPLVTYIAGGVAVPGDSIATRWTSLTGAQDLNLLLPAKNVNLGGYTLLTASGVSGDGQFISGIEVPTGSPANTGTTSYVLRYCDDTVAAACAAWDAIIASSRGGGGVITNQQQQQASIDQLGGDGAQIMSGEHGFAAPLIGDNSPILQQPNEGGAYAAIGSLSGGLSGRFETGGITLTGGIADASETYAGASMSNGFLLAGAVRGLVPFKGITVLAQFGGWFSPAGNYHLSRTYSAGGTPVTVGGDTSGTQGYVFGRFGPVLAPTPDDEVALTGEVGWQALNTGAYTESGTGNPFPATVSAGTDQMGVVKARVQWTHTFSPEVDTTLWAAVAAGFARTSTTTATIPGLSPMAPQVSNPMWLEGGARVGYHLTAQATIEGFVDATVSPGASSAHVGGGLKVRF